MPYSEGQGYLSPYVATRNSLYGLWKLTLDETNRQRHSIYRHILLHSLPLRYRTHFHKAGAYCAKEHSIL